MQYCQPEKDGTFMGCPVPFYHEGTLHLFYLVPDDRKGCQEWGHLTTTDLVNWKVHGPALSMGARKSNAQHSLRPGAVVSHDGRFFAVFGLRVETGRNRYQEQVCIAVSDDCEEFKLSDKHRVVEPPQDYPRRCFRDPCLFHDDQGLFHLLVATEIGGERPPAGRGCLIHLESLNLCSWKVESQFLIPGLGSVPESPDFFQWNDWYYVTFLDRGQMQYRMSRDPQGPWLAPPVPTLDTPVLNAMRTVAFNDNRRLAVGYLAHGDDLMSRSMGCAVFRELVQRDDGTLGTRFVEEMIPATEAPAKFSVWPLAGDVDVTGTEVRFRTQDTIGTVRSGKNFTEGRITTTIVSDGKALALGIAVRGGGYMQRGYEVRFLPQERTAWIRDLELDLGARNNRFDTTIHGVDGLDQPFDVDLVLTEDVIDVAINGERTLIAHCPKHQGNEVYLFCINGDAVFQDVTLMPACSTTDSD